MFIGRTVDLYAAGGVPPYDFTLVEGGGRIIRRDEQQLRYDAPDVPGTATIRVDDDEGNSASVLVSIVDELTLEPSSAVTAVGRVIEFEPVGGASPYTFSVTGGSIDASGRFTAPDSPGPVTVTVEDDLREKSTAQVTVNPALSIAPDGETITTDETLLFTAADGVPPYAFDVDSGGGAVNSAGLYDPGTFKGSATVVVEDGQGNTARADLVVVAPVSISPGSQTVRTGESISFSASGGTGGYTWRVLDGGAGGSVDNTGAYTAPGTAGTDTVQVTDSDGNAATAVVTVELPVYRLTVTDDGNGSTDPAGTVDVTHGTAREIIATNDGGYTFSRWTVEGGTASIANADSASTTVTLTAGDATVQAVFVPAEGGMEIIIDDD